MIIVIRLLLAFELTATVVEEVGPSTHGILPLGGSDLAQLGIALVLAVLLKEIWDAAMEARTVWRQRRRQAARRRRLEQRQSDTSASAPIANPGTEKGTRSTSATDGAPAAPPDDQE